VLVTEAGGVKLVGFDCALADRDEVLGLRSPMAVANYLAPEAFRGKQSAELPACDLFSLGVILYESLTGELPWRAETPGDLVLARRAAPAPRVSTKVLDCPVWLDVLVSKLLQVKREDRLQTAEATHRAIVDAKQKVAAGMGAVQHAWSGRQGALATTVDRHDINRLRKKQLAVKERDDSPWYERAWFLALCLAAVVAGGAWAMWPESEDALFAKARPLMESDDPVDWRRAEEQYLDELRQRFPNTRHADEIADFEKRYAMFRATQRIRNFELTGRMPDSEIERRYAEAWRYERFGDRLTAWQKYDALVKAFPANDSPDDQAYVDLARQRIAKIKASAASQEDLAAIVREKLNRAKALADDDRVAARALLESIVTLYDGNLEVQPLVDEARQRIGQLHAGPSPKPERNEPQEANSTAEAPPNSTDGSGG
jgi:serine/threonine-protein kinase